MDAILNFFRWQGMIKPAQIRGEIPSNKAIYKRTYQIAWPSAVESVLIALIGAVDLMMVGNLGSASIAAVGITNQPKFLVLATILALNTGVTVLVSRRKGAGKQEEANTYLRQALLLSVGFSFLLSFCGALFAPQILAFAGATPDYLGLAVTYFRIIMFGNFFYCIGLTITAAQRGVGNTRISMITNIAANLVNLVFNALLINGLFFFPRLEVAGAAIATAIGNIVSFLIAVYSVTHTEGFLKLHRRQSWKPDIPAIRDLYNISWSAFVEQIFLRIGFLMYAKAVAGLGTVAFAAHQIVMNIMSISFSVGDGLSIANTSLVGQSLGASRSDMAIIYGKVAQRIGLILAILVSGSITLFRAQLMALFTNEAAVILAGETPLIILSITVLFQIVQVIIVGSLRGAGDVKYVALLMFVSVTIVRPVLTWVLCYPLNLGLPGAWLSVLLDQFTRYIVSYWRFREAKWTRIQV
ncbi:MATE family efflux transporter [uncultured Holdemania sp.]|uniref:MATE family efflux transporter n=1 Tax=uncultured Holdemania sp. TaxID=527664 RepID=UPI002803A144|nr:MATE family efflux transporter [uncultured Holdemania sp.]